MSELPLARNPHPARTRAHTPERLALLDQLCLELGKLSSAELAELTTRAQVSPSTLYRWTAGITKFGRLDTVSRVGAAVGWRLQWRASPY